MTKPPHTDWFKETGESLKTVDGKDIEVWEFCHQNEDEVLSQWAKHFRNHYCLDSQINLLRGRLSRSDYLHTIKFPSSESNLGPGIRAGDFGEILVADYLEWLIGFWVPRVRWSSKVIRDDSPKGSDIIGFKFEEDNKISKKDVMVVFESKTKFSASKINRLQDAINDSAKDNIRIDESLNYIKQRLLETNDIDQARKIDRFQNPVDIPYVEIFGAAAIISENFYNASELTTSDCMSIPKSKKSKKLITHPKRDRLTLLVIKGKSMMELVNDLYRRAADEA
jgi:hypothetical protein